MKVTSRDNNTYSAIGTELPITAALCATARAVWLLDTDAHQHLGASQRTLSHRHFDITISLSVRNLSLPFSADHAIIMDGLQRSPSINDLPGNVQGGYQKALRDIHTRYANKDIVTPLAVLIRRIPLLPPPKADDTLISAMLATDSFIPRLSADSTCSSSDTVP